MPRYWDGKRLEGQSAQRAPTPDTQPQRLQHTKVWAVRTQASPTRLGIRSPRTPNLPHPVMQTRREPAGESYPLRPRSEDHRTVLGTEAGPAAIRLPPPLTPSRLLLSLGVCSIEPPKPAAGGNRRKVARGRGGAGTIRFLSDLAREQRRAQCHQRSRAPSSPCAAPRTQLRIPCNYTEGLRNAGKLLLLNCCQQMGGGPSHRQVSRGRCNVE